MLPFPKEYFHPLLFLHFKDKDGKIRERNHSWPPHVHVAFYVVRTRKTDEKCLEQ